jgi:hypothetical protein
MHTRTAGCEQLSIPAPISHAIPAGTQEKPPITVTRAPNVKRLALADAISFTPSDTAGSKSKEEERP